jgi:hypothetical protein
MVLILTIIIKNKGCSLANPGFTGNIQRSKRAQQIKLNLMYEFWLDMVETLAKIVNIRKSN